MTDFLQCVRLLPCSSGGWRAWWCPAIPGSPSWVRAIFPLSSDAPTPIWALTYKAGFPTTAPHHRHGSRGPPCPARFKTLAGCQSPILLLASLPLPSADPPLSALSPPLGSYFPCETKPSKSAHSKVSNGCWRKV